MLIKSILLKNVRSYKNTKINFNKGSTLISGDIGSGKSTILLALEFSLFGLIKDNITPTSLLRRGENSCEITVNLEINNKQIEIQRTLKKTKNGIKQEPGFLTIDNQTKPLTPVELKNQIENLLGYPQTKKNLLYRYSVYTPQEMMKQIIFENEESRQNIIRKVFGIDKYKTIKDNITILTRSLKAKIKANEEITKGIPELKLKQTKENSNLKEFKTKITELEPKIKQQELILKKNKEEQEKTEEQLNQITKKENDLKIQLNKIKEHKIQIEQNNNKITQLNTNIKEYQTTNSKIKIIQINQKEETIKEQINTITSKYHKIQQEKQILKEKINTTENKTTELNNSITILQSKELEFSKIQEEINEIQERTKLEQKFSIKLDEINIELEHLNKQISTLNAKIKLNNESTEKISHLQECPTCLQEVSKEHKIQIEQDIYIKNQETKDKIKQLSKQQSELKIKQEALTKHLQDIQIIKEKIKFLNEKKQVALENKLKLKQQKEELEKQNNQIKILNKNQEELNKTNLDELLKQKEELNKTLNKIQQNKENILKKQNIEQRIKDSNNLIQELTKTNENLLIKIKKEKQIITNQEEIIKNKQNTKEQLNQIKQTVEKTNNELTILKTKESSLLKDIEYTNKTIEETNKQINKIEEIIKQTEKLKTKNIWFNTKFLDLINTIEKQVMLQIHDRFNSKFKEWFNMMIEDEDITAKLNENFTPIITLQGHDAEHLSLSGGEKTSLALAYRLALNKVINELVAHINTKDLIILDEPTDGFSSQQLDRLKEVLDNLQLEQIIIVSHETKIESYVQNIIKLQKTNHETKCLENYSSQ